MITQKYNNKLRTNMYERKKGRRKEWPRQRESEWKRKVREENIDWFPNVSRFGLFSLKSFSYLLFPYCFALYKEFDPMYFISIVYVCKHLAELNKYRVMAEDL